MPRKIKSLDREKCVWFERVKVSETVLVNFFFYFLFLNWMKRPQWDRELKVEKSTKN